MNRIILHLDMDAFFASVEQAVNPALRGRPVIVGSRGKKDFTVVAACSYEAKARGIESGMRSSDAFALCPSAVFVSCDSARYMSTSDRIYEMLKGYSERLERASIDEFNLDLSERGWEGAEEAGRRIKARIREEFSINGSVGIASTRTIAKIAAKAGKPDGLRIVRGEDSAGFLYPLAVEKIPGIGSHLKQFLNEMCVFTIADLAAVSVSRLSRRFGKNGIWMYRVIRGMDDGVINLWREPAPPPKSVGHSYTVERELRRKADLEAWIRMLSEMVGYRLRRYGFESGSAFLYMRGNGGFFSREKTFHEYTADSEQICRRALYILGSWRMQGIAVRALGVSVSRLVSGQELRLLEPDRKRQRLLGAMDAINGRFGEWTICPAVIKDIRR